MIMKKTIPFILLISVLFHINNCKKNPEKKSQKGDVEKNIGIVLAQNSALRVDPYIFSALVVKLNKGDTIEITDKSSEKSWIGTLQDFWYKAKLANGITGWIFGKNIRVISSKDEGEISRYVTDFFKDETEALKKEIAGKWWSINKFEDFTEDALEFTVDGKYKSYKNQQNPKIFQGDYSVDFQNNELTFSDGNTFGENLKFAPRGRTYILYKDLKSGELVFKKISQETTFKDKQKKIENKQDKNDNIKDDTTVEKNEDKIK